MSAVAAVQPAQEPTRREVLAQLIALRPARHAATVQAAETITRARQAIEAAEAEVARFGDLDARIATERAAMVKKDESGPLPAALIAERDAHRAARERVEESRSALKVLEAERVTAEAALRHADATIRVAAIKVLLAEGARLAEELIATRRHLWHLETELLTLDTICGASLTPEQRHPLLAEFSRLAEPFQYSVPTEGKDGPPAHAWPHQERWRNLLARLQQDASAPVELEA